MLRAVAAATSTSPIGRAADVTGPALTWRNLGPPPPTASTLPHAWHSPQRPTHLTAVQPHSEQRNAERAALVDREEGVAMPGA